MAESSTEYMDINSNKQKKLFHMINGQAYRVTDLINGTCLSISRTTQKNTPTIDFDGKLHDSESNDDSATATITILDESPQDRKFTALNNIQNEAPVNDKPVSTFVYTDEGSGKTITLKGCIVQTTVNGEMASGIGQVAWNFLVSEYKRGYENAPTSVQDIIAGK